MPFVRVRKHYLHIPYLILGLLEFGLYVLAASLAEPLMQQLGFTSTQPSITVTQMLVFSTLLSCSTLAMGCYISLVREGSASILFRILVSFCLLGSILMTILRLTFPDLAIDADRSFWAILIAIAFAFISRWLFVKLVDAKQLRRRVVVYGTGKNAHKIFKAYQNDQRVMAVSIVGCVRHDEKSAEIDEEHILQEPANWVDFCKQHKITEIILAPDERRRSRGSSFPVEELLLCKLKGVAITDELDFYERELNKIELDVLKPSWLLLSDGFKSSKSRDWTKRLVDIFISTALFIIMLPFGVIAAIAIFLESGGPIFYHQARVGKDGKEFRIFKFRSMRQDAEKAGKAVWAQKNDSRVTRVGKFIRNTRIDEIPQLYNVLKGEMSFVGPRPERPQFVNELKEQIPFYYTRHQVKPGLMGWAQLKYPYGASVEDARNKLEYDLYYTKNHSFFMDVLIMIQTVEIVLLGKGVH